jgi:hypothetical protein
MNVLHIGQSQDCAANQLDTRVLMMTFWTKNTKSSNIMYSMWTLLTTITCRPNTKLDKT